LMNGGFTNGITNGCDWYAIFGGRQDWMYWWNGGREVTIELYDTKNPPGSALPQRWTNNSESFLAYMEETLKGIRGIVIDAVTHSPLKARVDVVGVSNVPVFTDSAVGDYHRLLMPGTYTLIAQTPGYYPDTVRNVVVVDSSATRVNMMLQPTTTSTVQEKSEVTLFSLMQNYPNPFNPTTVISYQLPANCLVSLKVFDLLGRETATLVQEEQKTGRYEVSLDGSHLASGVYFYRLQAGLHSETKKLFLIR
jgi:carboxypeptidase D